MCSTLGSSLRECNKHVLSVLDTGDMYILSTEKTTGVLTKLYEMMGLTVEETVIDEKPYVVYSFHTYKDTYAGDVYDHVIGLFGRVIPAGLVGIEKVIEDARLLCGSGLAEVVPYWKRLKESYEYKQEAQAQAQHEIKPKRLSETAIEAGRMLVAKQLQLEKQMEKFVATLSQTMFHGVPKREVVVVYNTYYKICLVVDSDMLPQNFFEVCTDFQKVYAEAADGPMRKALEQNLHQKPYEPETVLKKIEALRVLYDLGDEGVDGAGAGECGADLDKEIEKSLKTMYRFTKEVRDKIKASDVFDQVMALLPQKGAAVRRRIGLCLSRLGLERKRYADGIYFYGLVPKYEDVVRAATMTDYASCLKQLQKEMVEPSAGTGAGMSMITGELLAYNDGDEGLYGNL